MKPAPRVKLRSVSSKNQSLQDILSTCTLIDEVISVESIINAVHNTKLTFKKATGEKRVHFYSRLDISTILPADFQPSGNLIADINKLNLMGYDFTEDDLEIVNGKLKAKETSLGYIGTFGAETGGLCGIATNQIGIWPDFWYGKWTPQGYLNPVRWDIKVNGVLYPFTETGIGAKEIEEEGSELITWFEDWVTRFKGIEHMPASVQIGTIPEKEDAEYYKYVNFGDMCYEFELMPSHNYINDMPADERMLELAGNSSFTIHPDGRITFALAAFQTECTMVNAKPLSLKPINYDFTGKTSAGISYTITDIVTGEVEENTDLFANISDFDGSKMATNISDFHSLLVINSNIAYPSFGYLFRDLNHSLTMRHYAFPIKFNDIVTKIVPQTGPTTQTTYLGFSSNIINTPTDQYKFYLKEIETTPEGITRQVNDFGTIQITASDIDELFTKVSAFYKPKLEAAGFLVEEYNVASSPNHQFPYISNRGFKLTKTSNFDIALDLLPPGDGTNVWSDFYQDRWRARFVKVGVSTPLVTEEMVKDQIEFIIAPIGSEKEFFPFEASPKRITFHARVDAASDYYDWITENNNGQPVILETCGLINNSDNQT